MSVTQVDAVSNPSVVNAVSIAPRTRAYACEHCSHVSTGKGAAKRYNHHVIWSHTDQVRHLASGRVI